MTVYAGCDRLGIRVHCKADSRSSKMFLQRTLRPELDSPLPFLCNDPHKFTLGPEAGFRAVIQLCNL